MSTTAIPTFVGRKSTSWSVHSDIKTGIQNATTKVYHQFILHLLCTQAKVGKSIADFTQVARLYVATLSAWMSLYRWLLLKDITKLYLKAR